MDNGHGGYNVGEYGDVDGWRWCVVVMDIYIVVYRSRCPYPCSWYSCEADVGAITIWASYTIERAMLDFPARKGPASITQVLNYI